MRAFDRTLRMPYMFVHPQRAGLAAVEGIGGHADAVRVRGRPAGQVVVQVCAQQYVGESQSCMVISGRPAGQVVVRRPPFPCTCIGGRESQDDDVSPRQITVVYSSVLSAVRLRYTVVASCNYALKLEYRVASQILQRQPAPPSCSRRPTQES